MQGTSSETSVHLEQEKFMCAIVNSTPSSTMRPAYSGDMHDSTLSITSLVMGVGGLDNFPTLTPEIARRSNPLQKAVNSLRSSGGKGGRSKLPYHFDLLIFCSMSFYICLFYV